MIRRIFILLLCLQALQVVASERVALVMGNGSYANGPLKNPVNDADDLASALEILGFRVAKYTNSTRQEMRMAIRAFGDSLKSDTVALVYYAGHGVEVNGINYLIPIGADIERVDEVPDESISLNSIMRKMETASGLVNIVLLDACRDNPYVTGSRSASRGLRRIEGPMGSFIAYSTAPGQVAADGEGRNGLFTHYLLAHLGTPNLTIGQIMSQVRRDVAKASKERARNNFNISTDYGLIYNVPT